MAEPQKKIINLDELYVNFLMCIDNNEDMGKTISVYHEDTVRNDSRVKLILEQLKTYDLLPFAKIDEIKSDKSSDKSIEYRNTGNILYAKKDWMGALSFYTKSIAAAPYPLTQDDKSNELAVAFANRSAVLFAMAKYEACLSDIDNALKFDYPDYLIYKLLERKGKCFQHLGKFSGASKCIQRSIDFLPLATSLSQVVLDQTLQRLKSLYIETSSKSKNSSKPKPPEPQPPAAPEWKLTSREACFIGCINLKFTEETGRYIVASRDIKPGEVLVAEDPYAAVLVPEFFSTHCFNCLRRFNALIPCKTCSLAMFCTANCQEDAWEKYHRIECPVLSKLFEMDMPHDWMLALRLLLVASYKSKGISCFLKKINMLNDNLSECDKFNEHFASDPDYGTMHCLVHNYGKRKYKEVHKLTVAVACIVNCLDTYTDLFSFEINESTCSTGGERSTDLKIVLGGLLLQYIQSVQCNSYSTSELLFDTKQENDIQTIVMGGAVYRYASMINHSCNPNVVRSNHSGSSITLVASMPIKKGEEICCDYGYQFCAVDRNTRKEFLLQKYYFDCNCEACKNDWPTAEDLDVNNPTFLCPQCEAPLEEDKNPVALSDFGNLVCSSCKKKVRCSKMWEQYKPVVDDYLRIKGDLLVGCVHDFTPDLCRMVVTLDSLVKKPSRILLDVQDAFRHCAMQMGNFYPI